MKISAEELASAISARAVDDLPKIILINGNEPLLIEESLDQARNALKQLGFTERVSHQLESGFDWNSITGVGQAMSLFAERRIVELRVPGKLGVAGTKAITEYCDNPPEDDIFLLVMPMLDYRQRQAKWVKYVDSLGWIADCADITPQQFPAWIKRRLQSRALRVENGVVDILVEQLEGNVLAAAQEIDKLQVLADNGAVTLKLVNSSLADQARFDVYTLTDVCLSGDFSRVLRIKQRLQTEGVEPVILVWSLVREIRTLATLAAAIEAGQNRSQLFKQHRIWSKRESVVTAALNRNSSQKWLQLLAMAANLDQSVKGQRYSEVGPIWHQIECLCAAICGVEPIPVAANAL